MIDKRRCRICRRVIDVTNADRTLCRWCFAAPAIRTRHNDTIYDAYRRGFSDAMEAAAELARAKRRGRRKRP
jgi:hypothetical protein